MNKALFLVAAVLVIGLSSTGTVYSEEPSGSLRQLERCIKNSKSETLSQDTVAKLCANKHQINITAETKDSLLVRTKIQTSEESLRTNDTLDNVIPSGSHVPTSASGSAKHDLYVGITNENSDYVITKIELWLEVNGVRQPKCSKDKLWIEPGKTSEFFYCDIKDYNGTPLEIKFTRSFEFIYGIKIDLIK